MTYDQFVRNLAQHLRDELKQVESISRIDFELTIDGRVDGDLNVKFQLGASYSHGGVVSGHDLNRVIDEFKRRHGWDERNQPLMLSNNGEEA